MSTEQNPLDPPQVDAWLETAIEDDEADAIRRRFLNREACIRGIGWLYVFGVAPLALEVLFDVFPPTAVERGKVLLTWINDFRILAFGVLFLWLASGLPMLRQDLRRTAIGVNLVSVGWGCIMIAWGYFHWFFAAAFAIVFPALYLPFLVGSRARYVCSAEYRKIIEKTPRWNQQSGARGGVFALGLFALGVVLLLVFFAFQDSFAPSPLGPRPR